MALTIFSRQVYLTQIETQTQKPISISYANEHFMYAVRTSESLGLSPDLSFHFD